MKANELRIGNWIKVKSTLVNKSLETQVSIHDFKEMHNNRSKYTFNPIELTEEWLLKFGFDKGLGFDKVVRENEFGKDIFTIAWNDVNKWYCFFRNIDKTKREMINAATIIATIR